MSQRKNKIVVVGAGVAGAMAALAAAEKGADVYLVTLCSPRRSVRGLLSDGIDLTAKDSEKTVRLLERMGVLFNRTKEGQLDCYSIPSVPKSRFVYAGANTKAWVLNALDRSVRFLSVQEKIHLFEGWELLALVKDDGGGCRGIAAINTTSAEVRVFAADAVIMAAGGYEGVFGRYSANPVALGSALGICIAAGAKCLDLDKIEESPYTFELDGKRCRISNQAIAAGAKVVAAKEQKGAAYLDVTHIEASWLDLHSELLDFYEGLSGEDPFKAHIKIVPAVVRTLGCLRVEKNCMTNIDGLFAAASGEDEIVSSVQSGLAAGINAVCYANNAKSKADNVLTSLVESARTAATDLIAQIKTQDGEEDLCTLKRELAEVMFDALVRNKEHGEVATAKEKISELGQRLQGVRLRDTSSWANEEILEVMRFKHGLNIAALMLS